MFVSYFVYVYDVYFVGACWYWWLVYGLCNVIDLLICFLENVLGVFKWYCEVVLSVGILGDKEVIWYII